MHRYLTRAALVALGGAIAVAATGCVTIETRGSAPASSAPATGDAGLGSAPSDETTGAPAPTGSPAGQGGQPGGGGNTGGNNTGGNNNSGTTEKKPTGPTIVYYRIKQKPQCDQGTNVNRIPGIPVILEWKVTGTDKITLSVDGPGIYNTYPAVGTATIDFPCAGIPGEYVKHTYQLRTVGGGEVRSKTLTASALVHEIPMV
ncbi:hypothetical protein GCM10022225_28770 [Plantactinospora mayteni]|uniref:Lipoprotein n=1 Tax=Plantactinospora mayteni TaxID=566021 RepID=A0ABQ4ET77_9ACTN|nr:hypothetical protein [Plantactinospora mayteni]GIG97859.1 hypothetical protein Pma05_44320 [Plantactinospora mayteni]